MERTNARGIKDVYFSGEHINIKTLQDTEDLPCQENIRSHRPLPGHTDVPFYISKVSHVTTESGLDGILHAGGFQGGAEHFLWWGLAVEEDDIRLAEEKFMVSPDRTPWEMQSQRPFLQEYTTSPAFRRDSRYGNFRFTLSLWDLKQMYSEQLCGGEEPVMRVYGTTVYKHEIMYTVVVHSPRERKFEEFPGLWESGDDAVCLFRDRKIVWRAQALSETLCFDGIKRKPSSFVWDHVTLAFHLPEGQTLRLDKEMLIQNLTACRAVEKPFLGVKCVPKTYAVNVDCVCGCCWLKGPEANRIVEQLKRQTIHGYRMWSYSYLPSLFPADNLIHLCREQRWWVLDYIW